MPKILLVEDNEMNRDMLSRRLQRRGYDIVTAESGEQGLSLARREAIPASARNFWSRTTGRLNLGLGLAEAGDAVAGFPLAALLQDGDPFKSFHDIAFGPGGACRAQTSML